MSKEKSIIMFKSSCGSRGLSVKDSPVLGLLLDPTAAAATRRFLAMIMRWSVSNNQDVADFTEKE